MRDRTAALLIFVPLSLMLLSCSGRKDLGGGFELVTEYSGAHAIVGPKNSHIICSDVSQYKINAKFIVGRKELPRDGILHSCQAENVGFLIIDKQEGTYVLGLSEEDFRVRCDELGIDFCQFILEEK